MPPPDVDFGTAVALTPPARGLLGRRARENGASPPPAPALRALDLEVGEPMELEVAPADPRTAPLTRLPAWFTGPLDTLRARALERIVARPSTLLTAGAARVGVRSGEAARVALLARPFPAVSAGNPDQLTARLTTYLQDLLGAGAGNATRQLQDEGRLLEGAGAVWLMVTWAYWVAGELDLPGLEPPAGFADGTDTARRTWSTRVLWIWTADLRELAPVAGLSEAVLAGRLRGLLPEARRAGGPYRLVV